MFRDAPEQKVQKIVVERPVAGLLTLAQLQSTNPDLRRQSTDLADQVVMIVQGFRKRTTAAEDVIFFHRSSN
jgi:hypothetical protein